MKHSIVLFNFSLLANLFQGCDLQNCFLAFGFVLFLFLFFPSVGGTGRFEGLELEISNPQG